ncbi:hypothetical protein, partial [Xanthomonas oryzae]
VPGTAAQEIVNRLLDICYCAPRQPCTAMREIRRRCSTIFNVADSLYDNVHRRAALIAPL